jgi:nucleoside-diphosphate-sugar epimerase
MISNIYLNELNQEASNRNQMVTVTGGAGYVGSILVRYLLTAGYRVLCLDKLIYGGAALLGVWHHPDFSFKKCDITEQKTVESIFKQKNIHAVIHLSAIVGDPACKRDPDRARAVNLTAATHLFELAKNTQVARFIFASTCSNYGKMADPNAFVDENSPLTPVSLYAETKVRFEELILDKSNAMAGFSPTSLRFATAYGVSPRMRFDLTVNEFTKELALGNELLVYGQQFWRPYCHVADFSRAILSVLTADMSKVAYNVFNVGDTEENYTKKMILDELLQYFPNAQIRSVKKAEDPRDYRVNFAKIKNELNFGIIKKVPDGIKDVKDVINYGVIVNPEEQQYYNIPHKA